MPGQSWLVTALTAFHSFQSQKDRGHRQDAIRHGLDAMFYFGVAYRGVPVEHTKFVSDMGSIAFTEIQSYL